MAEIKKIFKKNNINFPKTVIVLGMHRSGTSMVAGILSKMGVNMGKHLIGASWSNPSGHFEDEQFVDLNIKIIKRAGGAWDRPPSLEDILILKDQFFQEIKSLIGEKTFGIWGWKDPRTTITIELYLPYLKNPYFVVCRRKLENIAKSLKRRDKKEIREGIKLAQLYYQRIDQFFERHSYLKRIEVNFDDVIKNPIRESKKNSKFSWLEIKQKSNKRD